ncbi:PepSY-associated TM helix domain-containing protein [Sphingobium sp. DEHP117]|uniref:PepSY domain-containing protein n=1 Tax=Sphingobium sp. DEHP117 TaxID=2993436 RepID=UPI0027D5EBF6|nr:PepSY domain-containing protein [Sphingobium sp. DEHP117]MDQ4421036.1 PepSY-associated TM helix domain-containing protein [Sphingobium sp. DEHP117]
MNFWRRWHRWLGIVAGVLLILMAVTGVLLQVDEVGGFSEKAREQAIQRRGAVQPLDLVTAARQVETHSGGRAIEMLKLEARKGAPVAIVRFAGTDRPVQIDLLTGAQKPGSEAPRPGGSMAEKVRLLILNLHTLGIVGGAGHIVGGIAGVAMAVLGGSGLWMWWVMRRERVRRGSRQTWFWK